MAITDSAKKALRASSRKRIFNIRTKAAIDIPLKKFRKLVSEKKAKEARELLPSLYKALDKAAKRKFIKANTAARYKSRIMMALKKLG
ncbi:MAG TPA: 30S ribosomal protein S20 [Candidatus Paceibacterota bacterium]